MQKRLGVVQPFTLTAASQASTKIGALTNRVRVALISGSTTSGDDRGGAFILFGDSTGLTVSSTNGSIVPAQWSEDFDVSPGQTFYCIASSTANLGALSLTELS